MFQEVDIEKIVVNPFQPRRVFDEKALEELAETIRTVGLIHPPVVRPVGELFELVSGERRLRAAKLAGFTKMPVIVREQKEMISAQAALIENIQRADLNAIEIAKSLRTLMREMNVSQEALSKAIGKKRSTIANYLRLLSLPESIQESVSTGEISMGHAKALLSLETLDQKENLLRRIVREDLSVRQAEEIALQMLKRVLRKKVTRDVHIEALEAKLCERMGTFVSIQNRGKRGQLRIDYYSLDDLERVLELMGL